MIHFITIISICCKYLGTFFFIKKQFAIGTYVLPLVPTINTTYSSLISRIFSTELLLFFQACIYNTHIHLLLLLFLTWHRIRKRMKMLIASSSSSRRRSRPLSLVLQQSLKIMTLMLLMVFLLDTGQCQDTVSKNL